LHQLNHGTAPKPRDIFRDGLHEQVAHVLSGVILCDAHIVRKTQQKIKADSALRHGYLGLCAKGETALMNSILCCIQVLFHPVFTVGCGCVCMNFLRISFNASPIFFVEYQRHQPGVQ
jgi:hypothetical protein